MRDAFGCRCRTSLCDTRHKALYTNGKYAKNGLSIERIKAKIIEIIEKLESMGQSSLLSFYSSLITVVRDVQDIQDIDHLVHLLNLVSLSTIYNSDEEEIPFVKCPYGCSKTFRYFKENEYATKKRKRAHHCVIRDDMNGGCYHYWAYDKEMKITNETKNNSKIRPIYFGFSDDLLESGRFLSLPEKYAIGTIQITDENGVKRPNIIGKKFEYVVHKVNKAFEEYEFIHLNFIALDRQDKKKGLGGHAEATCIKYVKSHPDEFNDNIFINKFLSNKKIIKEYEEFNFDKFMRLTEEDFNRGKNHLKFNKTQFLELVSKFKEYARIQVQIDRLERRKLITNRQVDQDLGSRSSKTRAYGSIDKFNDLIRYLREGDFYHGLTLSDEISGPPNYKLELVEQSRANSRLS